MSTVDPRETLKQLKAREISPVEANMQQLIFLGEQIMKLEARIQRLEENQ